MKGPQDDRIDVDLGHLKEVLRQARCRPLCEQEVQQLDAVLDTVASATEELSKKRVSIQRLRKMLFGARTEKTRNVVGTQGKRRTSSTAGGAGADGDKPKKKRKGHGRNGAAAYTGADKVELAHPALKPGDTCPQCCQGKVYSMAPTVRVRVQARAPVFATVYEAARYRCNLCGLVFKAELPASLPTSKYDESVGAMIGLLRYGKGFPFYRLDQLQGSLGVPLPASTQWDLVHARARTIAPAFEQLAREAAQGQVLYNDDTTAKILTLMGGRDASPETSSDEDKSDDGNKRTGVFTTGIVSTHQGRAIALFFTGRQHAGENLTDVLAHRDSQLGMPIQMCDALSRNVPAELETILCNCLSHGRRRFVDVIASFPVECQYVLEALRDVYANDALARRQQMSAADRLHFHQRHSGAQMGRLRKWMRQQFRDRQVEPNSTLGEAIKYMTKHWRKLTQFLRVAGAPLDSNIVERALKKSILARKNSYFYKTENGAWVGDLYMSLIHTCELSGINPFDYLVALMRHPEPLRQAPADWMPWTYQQTLAELAEAA